MPEPTSLKNLLGSLILLGALGALHCSSQSDCIVMSVLGVPGNPPSICCPTGQHGCIDSLSENSFCTNLQTDLHNCGRCGTSCPSNGGSCQNGTCVCANGQTVCDPTQLSNFCFIYANGNRTCPSLESFCSQPPACVDLNSDPNNCGSCFNVCSGGVCQNGKCTCPAGQSPCSNAMYMGLCMLPAVTCYDLSLDTHNCGACGNSCGLIGTG